MNLGAKVGLAMAGLVGLTALGCAGAAVSVTTRQLDAEMRRSIEVVADPIRRNPSEAYATCGSGAERDANARPPSRRNPRSRRVTPGVLVQCLDMNGAVLASSPSNAIPILASESVTVTGEAATRVEIDGERHLVVTVPVPDFGAVQIARSIEERDRVVARLFSRIFGIAGVATLLALMASWLLSRRIVRPLKQLTESAERIRDTADLSTAVVEGPKTNDEVGRLSNSFASMLKALRDSKEAQARLVQDAGHELRTPLTSVRMNVAMLSRDNLSPAKRAELKADVESELSELTTVTNELISLAADNARTETPVVVDVGPIVESACGRWGRRSQRNVSCSVPKNVSERDLLVLAGPTALARIVDNLIGNAVKFSPSDTPIEVAVTSSESNVSVSVRDHGRGIAEADLPRIFDRFYRSDEARAVSGSGLGLAIVEELVVRANGTVEASNATGGGALFVVQLPKAGVH